MPFSKDPCCVFYLYIFFLAKQFFKILTKRLTKAKWEANIIVTKHFGIYLGLIKYISIRKNTSIL